MSTTPEHEHQVPILTAADLKSILNNVDLSALNFATEFAATHDLSSVLPTIHDSETTEFLLPIANGNGETCGVPFIEDIGEHELNLSLSPLKTSDFCDSAVKKRRHSSCPTLTSCCPTNSNTTINGCWPIIHSCLLRRTKSHSNVNHASLENGDVFIPRSFGRQQQQHSPSPYRYSSQFHATSSSTSAADHRPIETVDVLGFKLPLVTDPLSSGEAYVCVSDVFQTFFSRRHWDEFKEILSKNGIEPVFGVVKNADGTCDDVNAISVSQCQTLLLNNQARKDGFVRCIRLSIDGSQPPAPVNEYSMRNCPTPNGGTSMAETKLIFAAERQVGELSSGIKTRHADQSDILYVEFDGKTLPSITVNDRQFVRIVDVQKNILTPDMPAVLSKQVSVLKKLCSKAHVAVTKCRPNEKSRLVVYANSCRSNSLHIIAAEDICRLVACFRQYDDRQQTLAVKKKYLKRLRASLDIDDADFDFAADVGPFGKRLRGADDDSSFADLSLVRHIAFHSADSSEPSPLSRPSSASTDTASCSGESSTMTPLGGKKMMPSPSATGSTIFGDKAAKINKKNSYDNNLVAAHLLSQQTPKNNVLSGFPPRKPFSSFEQMLASGDEFYKTKSTSTKQKVKNGHNSTSFAADASNSFEEAANVSKYKQRKSAEANGSRRRVGRPFGSKTSSQKRRNSSFVSEKSEPPSPYVNGKYPSSRPNFFVANEDGDASSYSAAIFDTSISKVVESQPTTPHGSSRISESESSSPSPPPYILPEISFRVDVNEDFDLALDETLVLENEINEFTRPCVVYLGRSAPLPVAVYNRRFQRGPAGYYYDYLFVSRTAECILCCLCKRYMSLHFFVQHTHADCARVVEPLLFMFVRNPTTDRFDLWNNLCAKAKTFGTHKLVNYNLPDDLAEYYEEQRYATIPAGNMDEQTQKEARSTAAILLALSRGK